eukprot:GHRQ01011616.1.p1 GENE.GHRQ01011616.1~~GHRQ01011616.1.p1  ORF type:complete len:205 (+),score=80.17 GHRQ01011616.1:502-1116(+)
MACFRLRALVALLAAERKGPSNTSNLTLALCCRVSSMLESCERHNSLACPCVLLSRCCVQEEFAAEMAALAAETAAAQQDQADAESALAGVQRELAAQQAIAADIAALEERYWHDLNDYQLSLQQHISERDGLLQRIDRAGQQLLLLKSTNVLNDTFRCVPGRLVPPQVGVAWCTCLNTQVSMHQFRHVRGTGICVACCVCWRL